MRRFQSQTKIYRPQSSKGAELDGIVSPTYRGYKISCAAWEISALQRQIDARWLARHTAVTPAEREAIAAEEEAIAAEEEALRFQPRNCA